MNLSIRKFLLFNLLLAITLTATLTAIGNYYLDQKAIYNSLDNTLSQAGLEFQALIGDNLSSRELRILQNKLDKIPELMTNILEQSESEHLRANPEEKYLFQIWNRSNQVILHSAHSPAEPFSDKKNGFSDKKINDQYWRVFTSTDPNSGLTFAVADSYNVRDQMLHLLTLDDIYIMLLIYPLSGILIWFIIGRGLRSIQRVASEVAQRAADHLNPVDLEAVPMEIQPLIDELNKLFLRLKQAFEREQRFAADAAHELRTPLAALRTQAQVALKATEAHDRQIQLQNVITGVDRCTHVIQQLLTLCRMSPDSATLENPVEVDINKLAAEVIGQLAPIAIDKQIEIELIAKDSNAVVMGNTTGLYALIRNLVDNAIRYTPKNGTIRVFVNTDNHHVMLRVVDNGPGIPVDLRARVFERFFRVLGSNAQGSGLGLAIVQQIVKLHSGDVSLGVPEAGTGLEVKVILPRSW